MTPELTLNPLERNVDDLLRFENFDRYVAQSAATVAGQRAELPERAPLKAFGLDEQFARMLAGAK